MRRRGGFISILIALGAVYLAANILPILAGVAFFLAPLAGIAFLVFLLALIVSSLKGKGETVDKQRTPAYRSVSLNGGNDLAGLEPEQADILREADSALFKARYEANKIKNIQIRDALNQVLTKADLVIRTMKEQPQEIRKANQFFSYYLPTIQVVLEKYETLEKNNNQGEEYTQKVVDFLEDAGKAFDNMYAVMFKDEKLDLEVEVEAMQLALKRDGLM